MKKAKNKTWFDVSLQQFKELQKIEEGFTDPDEVATRRMSVIFGEDVEQLSIPDFIAKTKECEFLATEIPTVKIKSKYTINGRSYVAMLNPFEMSMGQYIDFKSMQGNKADWEQLLTIFLIPDGHKYNDGYDLEQAKSDFLCLPIPDVLAIANFFFRLTKKYRKVIRHCLQRMMKKKTMNKEMQAAMEKIMAEITLFTV